MCHVVSTRNVAADCIRVFSMEYFWPLLLSQFVVNVTCVSARTVCQHEGTDMPSDTGRESWQYVMKILNLFPRRLPLHSILSQMHLRHSTLLIYDKGKGQGNVNRITSHEGPEME
jgi:hypothetical protein